uniref:Uncharacterized protein n=1 Tax=Lepeophtheirus salmonis TaxID=72036 RepID=A0A0K2V7H2_LEPSM
MMLQSSFNFLTEIRLPLNV